MKLVNKKPIALFLAVCMLFSLTGNSFAAEAIPEGDASSVQMGEIEFTSLEESEVPQTFSFEEDEAADTGFEAGELRMGKITPIDPETLKEYQEEFGDEVKDSRGRMARSSTLNFAASNLSARQAQPFPNNTNITFEFTLTNYWNTTYTGDIPLGVYVDDNLVIDETMTGGQMPANSQAVITFQLSAKYGGSHDVLVMVDPHRVLNELAYDDNSIGAGFKWQDMVYLVASVIQPQDGSSSAQTEDYKYFDFAFRNKGSVEAPNVPFRILVNNQPIPLGSKTIPGQGIVTGSFYLQFLKSGNYTVTFEVDPASATADADRTDNQTSCAVTIYPETAQFGGKWSSSDSKYLTVGISPDALSMVDASTDADRLAAVRSAVRAWNDIDPNVHIGTVELSPNPNDYLIYIDEHVLGEDDIGLTTLYTNKDEVQTAIPDYNVMIDNSVYSYATVFLNPANFAIGYPLKNQMRTISHEIGHVLGLSHPQSVIGHSECIDSAIMRQSWETPPLLSYSIVYHDRYNLNDKY